MYNDPKEVEKAKRRLNEVSPSFCMAKWMHSTLHLQTGRTHSCYLNPTHKIPKELLNDRPDVLHNTPQKVEERKQMKEGERPKGCYACWDVEDLEEEHYSERHFRGQDCWIKPFYDKVISSSFDKPINPTYLEISFSANCNFKCSYCAPSFSTSWQKEVSEYGGYQLSDNKLHHDPNILKANGEWPLPTEGNPYTNAFWKWWPSLKEDLKFFRITGGEPLLSKDTFQVLDKINNEPMPELELSINSNLGIAPEAFNLFLKGVKELNLEDSQKKKVKKFMLHTSVDTYGKQAEYIRNGLDFKVYKDYVEQFLEQVPQGNLSFMVTFNALSLTGFPKLIEWLLELRSKYQTESRQIHFDTPHLKHPRFMSLQMLPPSFQGHMGVILEKMKGALDNTKGIKESELIKMKRIFSWMEIENPNRIQEQADFRLFFKEHDKRRGTNFLEVFPEYLEIFN